MYVTLCPEGILFDLICIARNKWLYSTFPKFSSKARGGKPPEVVPLPHTIQTRGRCSIEIGPHIFPDTIIFEVHYLPQQPTSPAKPGYLYQPPPPPPSMSSSSWQATTPYGGLQYSTYAQHNSTQKVAASESTSQSSSKPLLSTLTSSVSITPALINQVNFAASSNPTLANLLQLAAAGKANPDQLKTLGLLIQSLAAPSPDTITSTPSSSQPRIPGTSSTNMDTLVASSMSSTSQSSPHILLPPVRVFDIVIEFQETTSERWIFPRGHAVCERILDTLAADATCDILITTSVPFTKDIPRTTTPENDEISSDDTPPQVVTFRFRKAPIAVWDTVHRWAGNDETAKNNRKILDELVLIIASPLACTWLTLIYRGNPPVFS